MKQESRNFTLATEGAFQIPEPRVRDDDNLVRGAGMSWQLRKVISRTAENVGRQIRLVQKRAELYVTDAGVVRRQQQQARNRATLEALVAISDEDQEFDLDELIEASIANPANRRKSAYRVHAPYAGFEIIAEERGHAGDFWTIMAPSRFHAVHSRSGDANAQFDGSTVRAAQDYLKAVWARIRAALNRRGIYPYGFRVAEPHHDGTPHGHMLAFLPPEQLESARTIVRRYALEDSPEEAGADRHRCQFKRIGKSRGSATGSIAKYIAKNVDGFALRADDPAAPEEAAGKDPSSVVERIVYLGGHSWHPPVSADRRSAGGCLARSAPAQG